MLRRLRRGSSHSTSDSKDRQCLSTSDLSPFPSPRTNRTATTSSSTANRTTFFSLPPELRTTIYACVAGTINLTIAGAGVARTKKKSARTPALLLTSKQTRAEFTPVLLARAPLCVRVADFDFRAVMRVTRSLYATERRALRENRALRIALVPSPQRCSTDAKADLRRWLVFCSTVGAGMGGLPWGYEVCWDDGGVVGNGGGDGVKRVGRWSKERGALVSTLSALRELYLVVEEGLRWEMAPIVEAMERELQGLGQPKGEVACSLDMS